MGSLPLVELAVAAVRNSIERLDRLADLGIVGQEQFVCIKLGLDRFEHVHRMPFIGADETDEFAMTVQYGPDAGALTDRRFAAAAWHRHREQTAVQHGLLDLLQHLAMVIRPREMKRHFKLCSFAIGYKIEKP